MRIEEHRRGTSLSIYKIAKTAAWCAVAAMLFCVSGCGRQAEPESKDALFSWRSAAVTQEREALFSTMQKQKLSVLYQDFSSSLFEEDISGFLEAAAEGGIEVYLLTGDPAWAEENSGYLCREVERAAAINEAVAVSQAAKKEESQKQAPAKQPSARKEQDIRLAGILFDVEPYLLDEWEDNRRAIMDSMIRGMKSAYELAQENGLELILCIPYYYDTKGLESCLETLIKDCCDSVAVMNYYREKEARHMETEAAFAKQYGKPLITIYELKAPGTHGLVEENTYHEEGLLAVRENFERLRNIYEGQPLSMAFHDYEALKEVMEHE